MYIYQLSSFLIATLLTWYGNCRRPLITPLIIIPNLITVYDTENVLLRFAVLSYETKL